MRLALAAVALLIGSVTLVGQLISVVDFALAQRLGLQERSESADALWSRAELNTARWDLAVLWTALPAAILMVLDQSWWPWVALISGGIHLDTGGREIAKFHALKAQGIAVGSPGEQRTFVLFLVLLSALGAALIGYALSVLA